MASRVGTLNPHTIPHIFQDASTYAHIIVESAVMLTVEIYKLCATLKMSILYLHLHLRLAARVHKS